MFLIWAQTKNRRSSIKDNTTKERLGLVSKRAAAVLNKRLDRRFVKTFIDLMLVIVNLQDRHLGLLLFVI